MPWQSQWMLVKFSLDPKQDSSISKKYDDGTLLMKRLAFSSNIISKTVMLLLDETPLHINFLKMYVYNMHTIQTAVSRGFVHNLHN